MKKPLVSSHYDPYLPLLRKNESLNGWYYLQEDEYWLFYKDNQHTGILIAWIPEPWASDLAHFHIRHMGQDICDASTLEEAKSLAELYYSR